MITPKCPVNHILVEIDKKYQDTIKTESGIEFFQDTTYRPEWHATITGKVISVPDIVNAHQWPRRGKIQPEVQVGDELIFSYLVIYDMEYKDDREDVFYEDPVPSPYITKYSNRKGVRLVVRYRYETGNFERWDVAMFDDEGNLYDKKEKLSMLQKDEWLGKFTFAETAQASYNNLVEIDGKEYWKVDYGFAIAVRRSTENGDVLLPIGGHAILNPPMRFDPEASGGKIQLLNKIHYQAYDNRAILLAIGSPLKGSQVLDCKPGDVVVYDKRYAEVYELFGKQCIVLKQEKLLAKI